MKFNIGDKIRRTKRCGFLEVSGGDNSICESCPINNGGLFVVKKFSLSGEDLIIEKKMPCGRDMFSSYRFELIEWEDL